MNLTVREASKLLHVSEKTIYRWVRGGKVPSFRLNEQYRFSRAELLAWATSRKLKVALEIYDETEHGPPVAVSLADALERGGIHYRVAAADKRSVLDQVVRLMALPEEVDRAYLLGVILAREALGSTAVGDGIAFPHARNPVVHHVGNPSVTLCFLEHPIDFGALDGQPVHTLFTVVTPTVRSHLSLLAQLAFALRDTGFRGAVDQQGLREQIFAEARRVEQKATSSRRATPLKHPKLDHR